MIPLIVSHATKGSGVFKPVVLKYNEGEEKPILVYQSESGTGDSPSGVLSKKSFTSLTQPDH